MIKQMLSKKKKSETSTNIVQNYLNFLLRLKYNYYSWTRNNFAYSKYIAYFCHKKKSKKNINTFISTASNL